MTCTWDLKGPVDYSTEACKAYHTLNERNDMLHGNVVLENSASMTYILMALFRYLSNTVHYGNELLVLEIGAVGLHKLHQEVVLLMN